MPVTARQPPPRPRGREAHSEPSLGAYLRGAKGFNVVAAPFIYSLAFPLVLLDAWVTAYQWICFPAFGMARVSRRRFFAFDRHRLAYLTPVEKLNCTFCAYATGLFAFLREVTAATEAYWCPIKHARPMRHAHSRYRRFFEFGDARGYQSGLEGLRKTLRRSRQRRDGD